MDSQPGLRGRGPIIVSGPLAPFTDGLRRELAGQGYAPDTIVDHVRLLADLSDWLSGRGWDAADLTTEMAAEFLSARRAAGHRTWVTERALAPSLRYLRGLQVVPPPAAVVAVTTQDVLLLGYRRHLEGERGLSGGTVTHYLRSARVFLEWLPVPLTVSLPALSGGQVIDHVQWWIAQRQRKQRKGTDRVTLPALRSLLRYLHTSGRLPQSLAGAVPAAKAWPSNRGLPAAAARDDIRAVLAVCDRYSAGGRRDYAIVLMMTRMGLRGGEVARLELSDVNWRGGELTIRGKGARVDVLPLPGDVGEAMADYLMHARPTTKARTLFVTLKAPFTALATASITHVVARACARAGVPRFGPRGMRHAVACDLLAAGAPMEEIGQLLRHAQQRTTAIYAKVDQARLAGLAMPCPTAAAR